MSTEVDPLILIVDDSPQNLQVAGEILGRQNFRIALAQSGKDALAFLETQKADLILLDIMMPGIDGFKVCQQLKENIETRFIPVIFLTARAQIEDIVRGFELGGADYLTKPFNDLELLARVKSQLELQKLQDMLRNKNRKLLEEIRLRRQREKDLIDYEKGRYVSVLIGGVAHEFNNLLQVVLGYGELVLDTLDQGSEEKELQDSLIYAGKKAAQIVEQLLFFADRPDKKLLEKLDLKGFFLDRISLFKGVFPEDIDFDFELPENKVFVMADRAELAQIMINIFLNSSKALKEKGVIRVKVSQKSDSANFVSIEVFDNGCGISDDLAEKVFDPFVTSFPKNGVGLGLSLVKAVVKRLGGYVELKSYPQNGTSCRICLPIIRVEASDSSQTRISQSARGKNKDISVLLVEDEESVLFLERKILENDGFKVFCATDGDEGLKLFKDNCEQIEIALLDVGLPGKSGIEIGKILEAEGKTVIYCTAYTDKLFDELADKHFVLQKPFKKDEIISIIYKAVQEL
jgi:DNA-binding response OmpR family regulator